MDLPRITSPQPRQGPRGLPPCCGRVEDCVSDRASGLGSSISSESLGTSGIRDSPPFPRLGSVGESGLEKNSGMRGGSRAMGLCVWWVSSRRSSDFAGDSFEGSSTTGPRGVKSEGFRLDELMSDWTLDSEVPLLLSEGEESEDAVESSTVSSEISRPRARAKLDTEMALSLLASDFFLGMSCCSFCSGRVGCK